MLKHTDQQIKESAMFLGDGFSSANKPPTLYEVLETIGEQIGLEIEIKGPEQESPEIVAKALQSFKRFNDFLVIISYELLLSRVFDVHCSGVAMDLLIPRFEK
jgi:glycerophosphoryl diester phosphodiesterase